MRITNNMLMRNFLYNHSLNQNSMSRYQMQLGRGGQRIFRPSDDPVGISRVLKYTSDINVLSQFKSTVGAADGHNKVTESAVTSIKELLHTIRQHAVAAADHTKTPDDIKKYAIEIKQLKQELVILGNSSNAGKHIFSGLETDKKLFNADGTYALHMTTERVEKKPVVEYEVTEGEIMKTGVHPVDLFGLIKEDNPMTAVMPRGVIEAVPAKRSEVNMLADMTKGYDGRTIKITINANEFTVDTSKLEHSHLNPMSKKRFAEALATAEDATGRKLDDFADIFFDGGDRLVVRNKTAGAGGTVSINQNSPDITDIQTVAGIDGQPATYDGVAVGGGVVNDADIAAATGRRAVVFTYTAPGGESKQAVIEIDYDTITDAAGLQAAIQAELNNAFPPAGTISVSASDGNPLSITISEGSLGVDSVVGTKSKIMNDIDNLVAALETGDYEVVNQHIDIMQGNLDNSLAVMGDIGGRTARLKYIEARIDENTLTFTDLMDKLKYADFAEMITLFKNLENVYRASLSVGSKIIQPSLVDFVR